MDYLEGLNEAQRQVVSCTELPLLVLAGAGSGKTRCIIHRAAYLIREKNVPPWRLLIVTFTNKAAGELRSRLSLLLNRSVNSLWVGTFHSICLKILRYEHQSIGFNSNFSIYTEDEQRSVLKKIYKDQGYDPKKYSFSSILSYIGRCKNKLQHPADISSAEYSNSPFQATAFQIYSHYQRALLQNQAMDFDDILLYTAHLLRNDEGIRTKYQNMFDYIMIDEYQDTNKAQFEIIHQLALKHQRVCVVGDDDQAIYSFRGANLRNILEFERDYQGVQSIRLQRNYRSTTAILNLANAVIKQNKYRHPKELYSELGEGIRPILNIYPDANKEAEMVAKDIKTANEKGLNLRDIAVLYRTNAQSRLFEHAMMQYELPYTVVGSYNFYQRKEIKDILAYLNVLMNPFDNESLLRIINEPPRGIGQTTINRLIEDASQKRQSLFDTIQNADRVMELNKGTLKKVQDFYQLIDGYKAIALKRDVTFLVKEIVEDLGLISLYQKSSDPKEITRAENLIEFVASVMEFAERFAVENDREAMLQDYLPHVALQTDMDLVSEDKDSVRLMTLHNAKGLEFDTVFIVGLENELLPHRMCMDDPYEIEEERRLFYVGITRAKRRIVLSLAETRRLYDEYRVTKASMFLQNLSPEVLDAPGFIKPPPLSPYKKPKHQLRDSQKHFKIGQKVWHEEYQEGVVLGVNGVGKDAIVAVSFKNGNLIKVVGSFLKTEV